MPFIEWMNSFSLGVKQFDDHHKQLLGLLNTVYDDFTTQAPVEKVGVVLDELIDYAVYHFAAEELWMMEHSYPELDMHREEHERFSKTVMDMRQDHHTGNFIMSLEVLEFLRKWLTDHILKTDAKYGRFIAAEGVPISLA